MSNVSDPSKTNRAGARPAEVLFRGHAGWLRAMLNRRFGAEVADDLAQDIWMRVLTSQRIEDVRRPRAFLWRVAANIAVDHRRRRSRRLPAGASWNDEIQSADAEQEAQVLLKQVILDLPDPLREVFLLSRVGGLTYESIARHLNISVKTVEWRMSRALARCAERLGD